MNNRLIRNTLVAVSVGIAALNVSLPLYGQTTDFCSKEVLLAYFPENFVNETLKKFKVPQDQWNGISKDLNAKEKDVVTSVEEKAGKMSPNPLKDRSPESRQETVKIFRETILEIFSSVLKAHGVHDDKQIQSMLADIQQQKARNFAKCMEKQRDLFDKDKSPLLPSINQPSNDLESSKPSLDSTSKQKQSGDLADSEEDSTKNQSSNAQDEDKTLDDQNNQENLNSDQKEATDSSDQDQ